MQASSNDAKLSGSGSNTAQGYTLYTFTIEDADGTITQQYYILKDYGFCLVQVTSFSGSEIKLYLKRPRVLLIVLFGMKIVSKGGSFLAQ